MTDSLLSGVKVVEFAHVIAGPGAGTLMADLGAEVIHVEPPQGETGRHMGPAKDGTYLWWKVTGRNKRCITLDVRREEAQDIRTALLKWADVVITNLRLPTVRQAGLDWESVHEVNPQLIVLHVSGFGTNTSQADRPGFGKVGEAMSGVVFLTGFPDGPPLHTGFSHGDSVAALFGAFSIASALVKKASTPDFKGEFIDLALFEPLFRLVEWQVIVHDQLGMVPQRSGNRLSVGPGAVINTYRTGDGDWVTVTSATRRSVMNVAELLGLDPEEFRSVEAQRARERELDDRLAAWVSERATDEVLRLMHDAEVVVSRIYSIEDIMQDKTYAERQDIVEVADADFGTVRMQSVFPKLRNYPGAIWRTGPEIGADNEVVFRDLLQIPDSEVERLRNAGVI